MAASSYNFTTGPATLPDVGKLSYNGCVFSPLFNSKLSSKAVLDNAQRTVKYTEYTLTVDGYVTAPTGQNNISATTANLYALLMVQGGALIYQGRGQDLKVNVSVKPTLSSQDVAWGPVPQVLEFQSLGGGAFVGGVAQGAPTAKIQWACVFRIPTAPITSGSPVLLQFNYETSVSYAEDGYSSIAEKGTMEIPITRFSQDSRTVQETVDNYRNQIHERLMQHIDFNRFRIVERAFNISRDKRTMEWEYKIEEKPYMDLPIDCTLAHGTFSCRPISAGPGLASWWCTLRASYVVAKDRPRRVAWLAFLTLLRYRMFASHTVEMVQTRQGRAWDFLMDGTGRIKINPLQTITYNKIHTVLWDFSFEEGVYLDSKTTSFVATFKLIVPFEDLMKASGIWTKLRETVDGKPGGKSLWGASIKAPYTASWLPNQVDPEFDAIVDFGGG